MRINSCNLLAALDISYISLPSFYSISPPLFTLDRSSPLILFLEISGTALSWFQSYLCHRTQFVSVNDISSVPEALLFGVPPSLPRDQ